MRGRRARPDRRRDLSGGARRDGAPARRRHRSRKVASVAACDNGGTATVVGEGRVAFDDCQLGEAVFDRTGEAPSNPFGWHLVAEELVAERSPARRLELDGDMRRLFGDRMTSIEVWLKCLLGKVLPSRRPMDNMLWDMLLKLMTLSCGGKQLVLKNPVNHLPSARVRAILDQ